MNKFKFTAILIFITALPLFANFVWYQNEQYVSPVYPIDTIGGTFITHVDNPAIDKTYDYSRVSQFVGNGAGNPSVKFTLINPITDLSELVLSLTLLAGMEDDTATHSVVGITLGRSDNTGRTLSLYQTITEGNRWDTVTYDFTEETISSEVLNAGGYDQLTIQFTSKTGDGNRNNFYLYEMRGSTIQNPAKKMMGSVGVSLNVWPNTNPDSAALEIVRELPVVGHVIANLSGFAQGNRFQIRGNTRVDIATEIHPNIVATPEFEERAMNAYKTIHESGRKVILYIAAEHFQKLEGEEKVGWLDYCNREFDGDEGAAYRHVIQGFVERTREFADGYWLDHVQPGTENLSKLVGAIREVHPDAILTLNDNFSWIYLGDGKHLRVDSDGVDDEDTTDYLVILYENWNNLSDMTCGHVGHGPLTSWAYDEKALPNIEENVWSYGIRHNTGYPVLKHLWFPIRGKYHAGNCNIEQNIETMYRWTRRVIDNGGAMTWSTTGEYRKWPNLKPKGMMMPDEMELMKELQARLLSSPMPDYEPYVRPEGAHFVGEELVAINSDMVKENSLPLMVSFKNNILQFNQNFTKASVYAANGKRIAQVNRTANVVDPGSVGKGVYVVTVELESGMKHNFRCRFK